MSYWFPAVAPERTVLDIGSVHVYWYSLLVLLGILAGFFLARRSARRNGIPEQTLVDSVFYSVLAGLIGARLWHVFVFQWEYYREHLSEIPKIWNGGIAIHGALVFGFVALVVLCRRKKISLWGMADILAPAVALGQAIGRWGNFFNQELYGAPTNLPWGVFISEDQRVAGYELFTYFHPTFFYESVLNFFLFALLYFQSRRRQPEGLVTMLYFIGYGIIRFVIDFVRIDPMPLFAMLRYSQWMSILFIGASVFFLLWRKRRTEYIAKAL